ncbi:ribonuclease P protein component [Candidatus Gottesmanbacteria bacterium]|nr:ribonuclease P protein component [Candidatus Gottesmanbacteria bacterium]
MAIPKNLRLTKKSDFKFLLDTGNSKYLSFAKVKISKTPNNKNKPRFAVVVSKAVDSKATERNKARRKITNTILQIMTISPILSYDYIFFTNNKVKTVSKEIIFSQINSIIIK